MYRTTHCIASATVTATEQLQSTRRAAARVGLRLSLGACLALLMVLAPAGLTTLAAAAATATEPGGPGGAIRDNKPAAKKRASAETPFGREGDSRKVKRVVTIHTSDAMRYFPDQIRVKKGQTVRLLVRNGGRVHHDMLLGTMDDLKKHAALTKQKGDATHTDPAVGARERMKGGR